jgi:hypothetical protein
MSLAAILVCWVLLLLPAGIKAQATPDSPQQEKSQDAPAAPAPAPAKPDSQAGQQANPEQSPPAKQAPTSDGGTAPSGAAGTPATDGAAAKPSTGTAKAAATAPKKKVVHNGGTTEPTVQISSGAPGRQGSKTLQTTNQLLAATDANLKKLSGHQLTPAQQETVSQIKNYMAQATTAAGSGDSQHAYTLAHKANLLAAELAGH